MCDFDHPPNPDGSIDDWDPTPEEIAEIERSLQEARMGFTYQFLKIDGKYVFKCNKCGREASMEERMGEPFPHKLNCPMRR